MLRISSAFVVVALCGSPAAAQAPVDPNRWESAIQTFEADARAKPPAQGGVVFIGSSSIARWETLAADFPGLNVLNRGFGGSELADSVKYAPRVVIPHAPAIVVLYAGENDLNRGVTPDAVAGDFRAFYKVIRTGLPKARVVVIGLKPSLLRWKLRDAMHETNRMIREHCASVPACTYVDPWPGMIGKDGTPRPELFVEDGLHMTPEGYKVWTAMLRPHLR